MKKRIGTRDYDTDASRVIAKNGEVTLYQKHTREKEFFICDGNKISHVENENVAEFLEMDGTEIIEQPEAIRAYGRNGFYTTRIEKDIYDTLYSISKKEHKSISEVIREILRKVGLM